MKKKVNLVTISLAFLVVCSILVPLLLLPYHAASADQPVDEHGCSNAEEWNATTQTCEKKGGSGHNEIPTESSSDEHDCPSATTWNEDTQTCEGNGANHDDGATEVPDDGPGNSDKKDGVCNPADPDGDDPDCTDHNNGGCGDDNNGNQICCPQGTTRHGNECIADATATDNSPNATATTAPSTSTNIPPTGTNVPTGTQEPDATKTSIPSTYTNIPPTGTNAFTTMTATMPVSSGGVLGKSRSGRLCTSLEPIIFQKDGDVFSLEGIDDETPTLLTGYFDLPVSNPDKINCEYIAEVTRENGETDIARFNAAGFVQWVTEAEGNDTSPTWTQAGNIVSTNGIGDMEEHDRLGNLLKNLGPGSAPVNANNKNLLAFTDEAGNLVVGDTEFEVQGVAQNFDWIEPLLYYTPKGESKTWVLNYETGETSEFGSLYVAPNPRVAKDGLVSTEGSTSFWYLGTMKDIDTGDQMDWH